MEQKFSLVLREGETPDSTKIMSLPQKAIDEFVDLYKEEFGVTLSPTLAMEKANSVFSLFKILVKNNLTRKDKMSQDEDQADAIRK